MVKAIVTVLAVINPVMRPGVPRDIVGRYIVLEKQCRLALDNSQRLVSDLRAIFRNCFWQ
jgi:hypothetical protein